MESFYVNEKDKIVKDDLFDTTAEKIAKSFVNDKVEKPYGVSSSQLRRLYDEVKSLDQELDGKEETWIKNHAKIRMIRSKVSYNVARAKEKKSSEADVYDHLSQFFKDWFYDTVKDEKDYHVFTSLFEAVYGFYWAINPERIKRS